MRIRLRASDSPLLLVSWSPCLMLEARQLSHRFGARVVLRRLDFRLESGSCAAVVGRNGAGKSTLLRIVAGLIEPSRGQLSWNGVKPRAHCALAAPDAPLYRELTCRENLRFFAGDGAREEELQAHLARWDLAKRAGDFTGELSSGLRARLGLAVASWFGLPILLLDEPSANLDESGRELVAALIEEQKTRGVVLLATNDARDLAWCDGEIRVGF